MYRILIVDDEYEIRKGLTSFFPWEMLGYKVAGQAEDGRQALNYLLKYGDRIDVVLADIKMPVMSGIELVEKMREHNIRCKVVLLSAYNDFEFARKALKLDVYDYALKPTEYKNLVQIFRNLKLHLDQERMTFEVEERPENYKKRLLQTVVQYMELNYATASLEKTAEYVNLSSSYLSTVFKEEMGMGFSEYLIKIKMEKAAKLLMDINYKTYDVSEMVGYSNAKNFARIFKKYYGVSPREYRNQGCGKNEKEKNMD